ncbi:MAG: 8-amino-7-oxononanoate synthase [Sedimentisphaerales bacterium]|nr:8-amino-7-oxononanoate synthase [Sedimentisphaerales bacterium]
MQDQDYQRQLESLCQDGLHRKMLTVGSAAGRMVQVNGEKKVIFCSNNYLGLAGHPNIIKAVKEGVQEWGFGSGGSRLVCGNTLPCEHLQGRLAEMLGFEACLVLPSGYTANHAILTSLAGEGDLIVMDKLVHASIIDGARASGAELRTWPHGTTDKLKRLLEQGGYRQVFIVTDSLFSMDGDKAPLTELVALKNRYGAILIVDEAHAFGCIGPEGKGCAAEAGVLDKVDIFMATFSKALGGAGGFIASSRTIIDYLVNKARSFIFTTGIPAINCLAADAALDIIQQEPHRRERLHGNSDYLRCRFLEKKLDFGQSLGYIIPIILGPAEKAIQISKVLWYQGFMAPAIRPPTVKSGSSRLRISVMSEHTKADMDGLCEALEQAIQEKL